MLILQDISYTHTNGEPLFSHLNLSIRKQDKISICGNNGAGKSTLLRIMAGLLKPSSGQVETVSRPYYVPQHFGQFDGLTVAEALGIDSKLNALKAVLAGEADDDHFAQLGDDWTLEERCAEAFEHWELKAVLSQPMGSLSGGQKTKVFLAGISILQPEIILLDEAGNHLDYSSRQSLYAFTSDSKQTLIAVSHDRYMLNLFNTTCELNKGQIKVYGGNYDFYAGRKSLETEAMLHDVKSTEKALRKAKETERAAAEQQQKLNARGKGKQEKAGLPTILINTFKNKAENSTARLKEVHAEKISALSGDLDKLRKELPGAGTMKVDFDQSALHKGKILVKAEALNYTYAGKQLWANRLNFEICSGERIAIKGNNGSGKTSLIRLLLGRLEIQEGNLQRHISNAVYIDQDYSLLNPELSLYEQAQQYNSGVLQEHEIKTLLKRFLFNKHDWDKPCAVLSGGERLRLSLCCLQIGHKAPDLMILDEPTNNLDLQNIEILTDAVNAYRGTLIVVSHDSSFLDAVGIEREIELSV